MEKVTQQIKQYSKCGKIVFSKKRKVFSLSDRTDISLSLCEIVARNGGKKDFISTDCIPTNLAALMCGTTYYLLLCF